ncbi:uncharacterized protein LOC134192588 isoform X2 [Corticium candelabrum]|uniref:uncharacterized protein LOC134192588 isoform X2 n=1 Tax=Corticium candelabrum TaxID=121492 RepID=UPI002E2655FC|nr:uncharacterized protein LOC134192588 isoform X2 [Corticium candelabrum]
MASRGYTWSGKTDYSLPSDGSFIRVSKNSSSLLNPSWKAVVLSSNIQVILPVQSNSTLYQAHFSTQNLCKVLLENSNLVFKFHYFICLLFNYPTQTISFSLSDIFDNQHLQF